MASLGPAGLTLISFIGAILTLTGFFALAHLRCRMSGHGPRDCAPGGNA